MNCTDSTSVINRNRKSMQRGAYTSENQDELAASLVLAVVWAFSSEGLVPLRKVIDICIQSEDRIKVLTK